VEAGTSPPSSSFCCESCRSTVVVSGSGYELVEACVLLRLRCFHVLSGATADSSSVDADKKGIDDDDIDDDDDDDDDEDVVDDDDDGRRGWETLEQDGRKK